MKVIIGVEEFEVYNGIFIVPSDLLVQAKNLGYTFKWCGENVACFYVPLDLRL